MVSKQLGTPRSKIVWSQCTQVEKYEILSWAAWSDIRVKARKSLIDRIIVSWLDLFRNRAEASQLADFHLNSMQQNKSQSRLAMP